MRSVHAHSPEDPEPRVSPRAQGEPILCSPWALQELTALPLTEFSLNFPWGHQVGHCVLLYFLVRAPNTEPDAEPVLGRHKLFAELSSSLVPVQSEVRGGSLQ